MKLVDNRDTIVLVVGQELPSDHSDVLAAERLREEIDARGRGYPYRRAVLTNDFAWLDTTLFHSAPTITVGGPGVNLVSRNFASELATVWSEGDRVLIQADLQDGQRRTALWGVDRVATVDAVGAFIDRGWLDEFLDKCWRFRSESLA